MTISSSLACCRARGAHWLAGSALRRAAPAICNGRVAAAPRSCSRRDPRRRRSGRAGAPSRLNSTILRRIEAGASKRSCSASRSSTADGEVAVAVTKRVGFLPALVDRQFDFEIGFGIAQIDKREGVEIQPIGDFEAECRSIEIDRARSRPERGSSNGSLLPITPPRQQGELCDYGRRKGGGSQLPRRSLKCVPRSKVRLHGAGFAPKLIQPREACRGDARQ